MQYHNRFTTVKFKLKIQVIHGEKNKNTHWEEELYINYNIMGG